MLNVNNNPWMGLASYDVKDSHLFFGRERELEMIFKLLNKSLSTVIYGESGVGKTSFIRAGLFPRLSENSYLPVWIRLEHHKDVDYFEQIERIVREEIENREYEIEYSHNFEIEALSSLDRLWILLYSSVIWDQKNRRVFPIIFFDQFEELFTLTPSPKIVNSFFEGIADLSQPIPNAFLTDYFEQNKIVLMPEAVPQIRFVYSLREDFLGALENASSELSYLFKNKVCIKKLNGQQAMDIIVKPCSDFIDHTLAFKVLQILAGVEELPYDLSVLEIEPTLLSLYCSELYLKASTQKQPKLTFELVRISGSDIIYDYYKKCLDSLPKESVNYIEKELLTKNGFRKQLLADDIDLVRLPGEYIDHLLDTRILRYDSRRGCRYYEFTHDILCVSAKRHWDEINGSGAIRTKLKKVLTWTYDLILNICLLNVFLSCTEYSCALLDKPLKFAIFVIAILGSLLMRFVNYAACGKIKWAAVMNVLLSGLIIINLNDIKTDDFNGLVSVIQWQFVILALFHFIVSFFMKSGKMRFIDALISISQPLFKLPLKIFLIVTISLVCFNARTLIDLNYSKYTSILGCFFLSAIGFSFLYERGKAWSLFRVLVVFIILGFLIPNLWAGVFYNGFINHHLIDTCLLFLLTVIILIYIIKHFKDWGLSRKINWDIKLKRIQEVVGIKSYYCYCLLCFLFLLYGPMLLSGILYRPMHTTNLNYACYVIPEGKEMLGEYYYWTINSIRERIENRLLPKNEDGLVGLSHNNDIVIPAEFQSIGQAVIYKPAEINEDGTVELSDYFLNVEMSDSIAETICLSNYLYLNNHFSDNLYKELDEFYHSSSSAKRRLKAYQQRKCHYLDTLNSRVYDKLQRLTHSTSEEEIYKLKWLVVINRMKELLILNERVHSVYKKININDFCELIYKEDNLDKYGFSEEIISAITFLNTLSENPSAFKSVEILAKCQNWGLKEAIEENMDILKGDPNFEYFVSYYL